MVVVLGVCATNGPPVSIPLAFRCPLLAGAFLSLGS